MIKVIVEKQSSYPISSPKIKKLLRDFLKDNGIVSDSSVAVAIVGEKTMLKLGKKYLKEKGNDVHNVLSFPSVETKEKFVYPPNEGFNLGEIVICFPKAVEEAKKENVLIEEKIFELVEHGALHLIGVHHK
jgi:probable rRNA maturation factor